MGSTQSPVPLQVRFYTKAGCHLCEDARDMLDEIATQKRYELTEIDIRRNVEIFEQYRYRIPVIVINETLVAEGRIEYSELLHAFDSIETDIKSRQSGKEEK